MTNKQQMELVLIARPASRPVTRRQRRLPGAHWWFAQMRLAVANATEWGSELQPSAAGFPAPRSGSALAADCQLSPGRRLPALCPAPR